MKLSKPYKKQLIVLDLLECGLTIVPKSFPKKSHDCIKRIMKRDKNIISEIIPDKNKVNNKTTQQYHKLKNKIEQLISRSMPGDNVNIVMYYNCLLCLIGDIKDQIPHTRQKLKYEWSMLYQSFNTLYKHIDCDLKEIRDMIKGEYLANNIEKVINGVEV